MLIEHVNICLKSLLGLFAVYKERDLYFVGKSKHDSAEFLFLGLYFTFSYHLLFPLG